MNNTQIELLKEEMRKHIIFQITDDLETGVEISINTFAGEMEEVDKEFILDFYANQIAQIENITVKELKKQYSLIEKYFKIWQNIFVNTYRALVQNNHFDDLMQKLWKYINELKEGSKQLDFDPNSDYFNSDYHLRETLKGLRTILYNVEHLNKLLPQIVNDLQKEVERRVNNGKTS